jgi:hypothetical protein
MLLLAAAAAVALSPAQPPSRPVGATAQAQAIIRIVSGVRLRFDQPANEGAPAARDTFVRTADALRQPAKLIEFE